MKISSNVASNTFAFNVFQLMSVWGWVGFPILFKNGYYECFGGQEKKKGLGKANKLGTLNAL